MNADYRALLNVFAVMLRSMGGEYHIHRSEFFNGMDLSKLEIQTIEDIEKEVIKVILVEAEKNE